MSGIPLLWIGVALTVVGGISTLAYLRALSLIRSLHGSGVQIYGQVVAKPAERAVTVAFVDQMGQPQHKKFYGVRLPVGAHVTVWFDPHDPQRAIIDEASAAAHRQLLGVLLLVAGVALILVDVFV